VDAEAVALATQLVKAQSGKFEPEKMPDEYAIAVKELIKAQVEQRAPEMVVGKGGQPAPKVINIMAALKQSVEGKGRAKVRDAVRKRSGKEPPKTAAPRTTPRPSARRTAH
jgi:DNA end-binding protein Ku